MLAIGRLLLALALAQAAPAVEQTGGITGRVTVAGASTPLTGVRIVLINLRRWSSSDSSSAPMDQSVEVAVTDADVSGVRIVVRRPPRR